MRFYRESRSKSGVAAPGKGHWNAFGKYCSRQTRIRPSNDSDSESRRLEVSVPTMQCDSATNFLGKVDNLNPEQRGRAVQGSACGSSLISR